MLSPVRAAKSSRIIAQPLYTVVLLDPCPLTRECIRQMLAIKAREFVIRNHDGLSESVDKLDFILLHLQNPDDPDVITKVDTIQGAYGSIPLVIMSAMESAEIIRESFCRFNLRGYIPMSYGADIMVAALRLIAIGGTFVPNSVLSHHQPRQPVDLVKSIMIRNDLTFRERQVLGLLREGKPNKIIAFKLSISEQTVKVHVKNMMKKLHMTNRTQLAVLHSGD